MSRTTLGTKTTESANQRDAMHVGYVIGFARHQLLPGEKVWLAWPSSGDFYGRVDVVLPGPDNVPGAPYDFDGIVDPFLDRPVMAYESVAILLRPSVSTNIHHDFDLVRSRRTEPTADMTPPQREEPTGTPAEEDDYCTDC